MEEREAAIYTLHSIVVHSGEFGSGHYYSYIRPDITKNVWYRYDDDRVTLVSFQQVREDSFGGSSTSKNENHKQGWSQWFFNHGFSFGMKQNGSSAYVLQYVKKREIPFLWSL
jgi:ubiquitin carboxyl-terminal hydrolase 7